MNPRLALLPIALLPQACGAALQFEIMRWTESRLDSGNELHRRQYSIRWRGDHARVSYDHEPILVRAGSPGHNGYFHQLDFGWRAEFGDTTLEVEAGLHGSSNMFDHTDFHGDVVVGRGSVMHDAGEVTLGLQADYRFGGFRMYPALARIVETEIGAFDIRLPTRITWTGTNARWGIAVERHGDKWAALDETRSIESKMYLDEWRASLGYRLSSAPDLTARVGVTFDSEIRYLDLATGVVERPLDRGVFFSLEVGLE